MKMPYKEEVKVGLTSDYSYLLFSVKDESIYYQPSQQGYDLVWTNWLETTGLWRENLIIFLKHIKIIKKLSPMLNRLGFRSRTHHLTKILKKLEQNKFNYREVKKNLEKSYKRSVSISKFVETWQEFYKENFTYVSFDLRFYNDKNYLIIAFEDGCGIYPYFVVMDTNLEFYHTSPKPIMNYILKKSKLKLLKIKDSLLDYYISRLKHWTFKDLIDSGKLSEQWQDLISIYLL